MSFLCCYKGKVLSRCPVSVATNEISQCPFSVATNEMSRCPFSVATEERSYQCPFSVATKERSCHGVLSLLLQMKYHGVLSLLLQRKCHGVPSLLPQRKRYVFALGFITCCISVTMHAATCVVRGLGGVPVERGGGDAGGGGSDGRKERKGTRNSKKKERREMQTSTAAMIPIKIDFSLSLSNSPYVSYAEESRLTQALITPSNDKIVLISVCFYSKSALAA